MPPRLTKEQRAAQKARDDAYAKGQAELAALATQALRWTEPVEPDVPIPTGSGLSKGWDYVCHVPYNIGRVDVACSSAVFHAFGRDDNTTTQQPRRLYSTRLLALRAMRATMEREFAKQLAKVDREIAREEATTND